MAMEDSETLVTLTADIVAAHVSNNSVAISDIPLIIRSVHDALAGLGNAVVPEVKQEPAVSIRASVKPDYLVCLEDGKKLTMMRRYLMTNFERSEEHTSELQSLMRISYAVFCLKKNTFFSFFFLHPLFF